MKYKSIAAVVAVAVAVATGMIVPGRAGADVAVFPPVPRDGSVYLGVSEPGGATSLATFDSDAGISQPAIYNKYVPADGSLIPALQTGAFDPGMTMMISWDVTFSGQAVTSGADDAYLAAQAAAVKAYAKPVFLRLDWEMNGSWYSNYSLPAVSPAAYIASWRYVRQAFAAVPNASFVWAPNVNDTSFRGATHPTSEWYPGDDVVDWVGLDAYPQFSTPAWILNGTDGMNAMAAFAQAQRKPMMLSEWAPDLPNADTAASIDMVLGWASAWPQTVKALVYFDFDNHTGDFTLADHPVGATELRRLTADRTRFLTSVVPSGSGSMSARVSSGTPTASVGAPTGVGTTPGVPTPPPVSSGMQRASARTSTGIVTRPGSRSPSPSLRLSVKSAGVGRERRPYVARLVAVGGRSPYRWRVTGLPAGIHLTGSHLTGAPRHVGRFRLDMTVTDAGGRRATRRVSVFIRIH